VVTPHVIIEDGHLENVVLRLHEWKIVNGVTEPQYLIKYAESKDRHRLERGDRVVIPYKHESEAIGRPLVDTKMAI